VFYAISGVISNEMDCYENLPVISAIKDIEKRPTWWKKLPKGLESL
jgi:hypothetical protein